MARHSATPQESSKSHRQLTKEFDMFEQVTKFANEATTSVTDAINQSLAALRTLGDLIRQQL